MIRALADAVLQRLKADPVLVVYDGEVPNKPDFPYVVVWSSSPLRTSDRLTAVATNADADFQTSAVGLSADQVRLTQEHIHAQLLSARLVVAGRNMAPVRHLASPRIQRDGSVDPAQYLGVDQWGVFSTPAI